MLVLAALGPGPASLGKRRRSSPGAVRTRPDEARPDAPRPSVRSAAV